MDKHARIQSRKDTPDSVRFASRKYKRVVKHKHKGFKSLLVDLNDEFDGGTKGAYKANIHRRIRRKAKVQIELSLED